MTLLEAISGTIRRLHDSPRTEEAYLHWIRAFVAFHGGRHPRTLGAAEITAFLNHLAVDRHTSASTQNQALCALVFLYRRVLALDLPVLVGLERAQRPHHLPAVLSRREVNALLEHLEPPFRVIAELLYGSGLRLMESVSIRVKDVDLERHQIVVRRGGSGDHILLTAAMEILLPFHIAADLGRRGWHGSFAYKGIGRDGARSCCPGATPGRCPAQLTVRHGAEQVSGWRRCPLQLAQVSARKWASALDD